MMTKFNIILIMLAIFAGGLYADTIVAQPESREIFSGGEVESGNANGDFRVGFYQAPLLDGNGVLAFKLPTIPEGMVIESATLHWYYRYKYSKRNTSAIDLYGLPYRAAATTPLITSADYYLGTNDTSATKIESNVFNFSMVYNWLSTDSSSKGLANYLNAQYDAGAQADDWALIRFNPTVGMAAYATNNMDSPHSADSFYYPYIEYTLGTSKVKMIAQADSREVYSGGQIIDPAASDPEIARIAYTSTGEALYDGNLVLAFKLPALPAGKVIKSATFNWFYIGHGSRAYPDHDLYGLPYKPAASTPVSFSDFYAGPLDTSATRIVSDVTDFDAGGQWQMTESESKLLAAYLQAQYDNGAAENDWALLRFNPVSLMNLYVINQITSPTATDELSRPYIELEFADASEGYWKALNVTNAANIISSGVDTSQPDFYVGSTTVNDTTQAIDAIFPFEFPALAAGEYVSEVSFRSDIMNPYGFPGRYFDIDMYGLDYRSSSSFQASDYFVGAYALLPAEGLNGTPIASCVSESYLSSQPATMTLDADASLRAACYINSQKASGATSSDYGFFRLNPRYVTLWYTRQMFGYPEIAIKVVTAAPTCLGTPDTEYACPVIGYEDYPIADQDGDCMVTLEDMKIVLSGWLECIAEPASYYCP
jgi:hypothetical protein